MNSLSLVARGLDMSLVSHTRANVSSSGQFVAWMFCLLWSRLRAYLVSQVNLDADEPESVSFALG